jgi:hypothetical protein
MTKVISTSELEAAARAAYASRSTSLPPRFGAVEVPWEQLPGDFKSRELSAVVAAFKAAGIEVQASDARSG